MSACKLNCAVWVAWRNQSTCTMNSSICHNDSLFVFHYVITVSILIFRFVIVSRMESTEEEVYNAFMEKVKRTVYLDNLSPFATKTVVRTALGQFGNVRNVQFIQNHLDQKGIEQAVLVEMGDVQEAKAVITVMAENPFMISGMPRPVRAKAAEVEMFDERPRKPGRKISFRWLDPNGPDFEVAKKMKLLAKKHGSEVDFILKDQLKKRTKLHDQQMENLNFNCKKYTMVDRLVSNGTVRRLERHYRMKISDD